MMIIFPQLVPPDDVRVRRPDDEQPASPGTPCVWVSSTRETVIHQPAVVPASQHLGVSPHGSMLHHTGACGIMVHLLQ